MVSRQSSPRTDSLDYRTEFLSPAGTGENVSTATGEPSWQLRMDRFQLPERRMDNHFGFGYFHRALRRQKKISEYYRRQEKLVEGFHEVDSFIELGILPGSLSEDEMKQLARNERVAIHASNVANLVLFLAKVYASIQSRSLAVIASTLDSLLDLLSGFILWFTANSMRKPNHFQYPIGKQRMQPVGIVIFSSVMATLGLQILFESGRELVIRAQPERDPDKEKWMIGIMVSVTVVKFVLMVYCRRFNNEIVRAYAQDHLFDVITNSIGLGTAVLAARSYWWIDPIGAILIALYTMSNWARTVVENVWSLIGRTAPPEYLAKLTYLIWNHDKNIKHIETVRAYTIGCQYFVEVHIVLPQDMSLDQAHNIGETLEEKLEQLPEVERAFVHVDFDAIHQLEHNSRRPCIF
ncbi:hypothetical protein OIU76_013481 [Salix suchowensis]|uniref:MITOCHONDRIAL METAL TRANSPORTER 1-RELATED n=1 Tax=Salix koriyanagi TaxID=2511006 RepID=A0A9Q0WJQ3_9ROSI|nr:metal tolerance protein [Salix suchowensis]KAJ6317940.1 hypothetical protein OIU76_013481 [Salix suchowensis]KAJ6768292.1 MITOCHONDRIAL METAL TRANSPORTER 1-RELATED [Salix koriyanagi]